MKRAVVYVIFIAVIILAAAYPRLMLNPGELSASHQEIRHKCSSCHRYFWGIESARCITCHKPSEIGVTDTHGEKLTGRRVTNFHRELKDQECVGCHTDHKGLHPEASLTRFHHDLLPASLKLNCKGCHDQPADSLHRRFQISCSNCHNTADWKSSGEFDHGLLPSEIRENCGSCHEKPVDDMHRRFPVACGNCHNTGSWSFSGTFDHSKISGESNCVSCHKPPLDAFHKTSGDNCNACHSNLKWTPSTFDHASYFILDNNHRAECSTCHAGGNYKAYSCYGCHEHSEGKIAGEHHEEGIYNFSDCVSCHRSGDEHDIRTGGREGGNREHHKSSKEHDEDDDEH
jgi:hypothetical protein